MSHDLAEFLSSRRRLEATLADPLLRTEAHYLLWEVCQACGDPEAALAHLDAAIAANPLRSRPSATAARSVLALAVPGCFQANLPLSMLFDETTQLHVLWLADPDSILRSGAASLPVPLPETDCVFVSIAEDSRHASALRAADVLAAELRRPVINNGARIQRLSRTGASDLLAGLADAVVPRHRVVARTDLSRLAAPYPFVARPMGSHAGRGLTRIDRQTDALEYLAAHPAARAFQVAPFVDYRGADGFFRKLRVVFVDGVAYPVHMAIHEQWALWYYNAGMDRSSWKRDEEKRFLDDMPSVVGDRAMAALTGVARRVELDYFGLDCAVLPDGRLLVFEVETGMIVHDRDPETLFAYKKAPMRRIVRAVERLIARRSCVAATRPVHLPVMAA